MLRTHGPDGSFEVEGKLKYHGVAIKDVTIDGLDIVKLIGQRLFGGDRVLYGEKPNVRITVEIDP